MEGGTPCVMVCQRGAERGAEQRRLLLCCREKKYPLHCLPRLSPQLVAPFFPLLLRRDARITFRRRCVRACVLAGTEENPVLRLFTWSFPVPRDHSFSSNRMQPGCALCFFAVGGRKRGRGGKGEQRTRKRQTGKMRRRNKQCVSIDPRLRVIFT